MITIFIFQYNFYICVIGTSKLIDSNLIMNSPSAGSWKVIDDNSYLINNSKRRMDFNSLGSSPGNFFH